MIYASQAEIYFIAGMFVLIMIISVAATYFFFRTHKREKIERARWAENRKAKKDG